MPFSYFLARTYQPAPEFEQLVDSLNVPPSELCRCAGVPLRTYERMLRDRRASRKTAERFSAAFALAHGRVTPRHAFRHLFYERPRGMMELGDDGTRRKCR